MSRAPHRLRPPAARCPRDGAPRASAIRPPAGPRLARAHGFALPSVLLLVLLGMTLAVATALYTQLDLRSTQHYTTGNQAFAAAEAGVLDVINRINTMKIMSFKTDIVDTQMIPTAVTALPGYPKVTYQVKSISAGANAATEGVVTVTGRAPLKAERVITVALRRENLVASPGALHLSNDTAAGTFSGNSMTMDGNNYTVTDLANNIAVQNNALCTSGTCPRPAISTRNDTVTNQVVSALAGQGTIVGLGSAPSVHTTASASTADLLRFVQQILASNGAPNGCTQNGANDYWLPSNGNPKVHCVPKTKGNQGSGNNPDFWGTMASPNITYVGDTSARIAGGSSGAGILIFAGNVAFHGSFTFCGWVLFTNPGANGIVVGGNPTVYGTVWSPLPAFSGNGNIAIKYSQNCLKLADEVNNNAAGNLPKSVAMTSWSES